MVSEAVEASPVGTKPPAAVDERICKDGTHDTDATVPHTTMTSSLQGKAVGSAFTPKLVESVVGPGSTRRAEGNPHALLVLLLLRLPCARES